MSDLLLAVDLGGSRCRVGMASSDDPASVQSTGDWPTPNSREDFVALIEAELTARGARRLGLGIPGLAVGTICRWVPNISYLDGLDIAERLPLVEIALGNDAHFALLAEASAGAAVGLSDAILIAIGTGIGSAVLADGRIVTGVHGGACSFGWAAGDLDPPGEGRNGWLERRSSGRALDRAAATIGLPDAASLVDEARAGRALAKDALVAPMKALGTALAGAVALLDPEAIIVAGGGASSLDVLAPIILSGLLPRLPPHLRDVELRAAQFGTRASLVGAAFAAARDADWRRLSRA